MLVTDRSIAYVLLAAAVCIPECRTWHEGSRSAKRCKRGRLQTTYEASLLTIALALTSTTPVSSNALIARCTRPLSETVAMVSLMLRSIGLVNSYLPEIN